MFFLNLPTNDSSILGWIVMAVFVGLCFAVAIVVGAMYVNSMALKLQSGLKDLLHDLKDEIKEEAHALALSVKDLSSSLNHIAEVATSTNTEFLKYKGVHEAEHRAEQRLFQERLKPYLDEQIKQSRAIDNLRSKLQMADTRFRDLASSGNGEFVERRHYESIFTEVVISKE